MSFSPLKLSSPRSAPGAVPLELPSLLLAIPRNAWTAVGIPLAFGSASGLITKSSVNSWYPTLRQPPGEPPRLAFPIAWTILYASMGVASHILVRYIEQAVPFTPLHETANLALRLYWLQFGLNMAWTPLFFGLKQTLVSLIDICALTPTAYALTYYAAQVDKRCLYLLAPYCAWLTFATYLNAGVWWLNFGPGANKVGKDRKDL